MKALLLAAGLGTRLKPITDDMPKCLVPINDKPLLAYWLDLLDNAHIDGILVNLHYFAEKVKSFISNSPYSENIHTVYEKNLLGTARTLMANKNFFKKDPVLLIHADNLSRFDLDEFILAHENRPKQCEITMMTFITETPESCGIVELDREGIVQKFYEKVKYPPGNLANGAVFILENTVLQFMENMKKEPVDFCADVLPLFIGKIYTFHNHQYHRDIGTMESYNKATAEFKS